MSKFESIMSDNSSMYLKPEMSVIDLQSEGILLEQSSEFDGGELGENNGIPT